MAITVKNITEQDEQALAKVFRNKTSGAEIWLQSFEHLRLRTLSELKGKFTEQELYALIDMRNGSIFEPMYASNKEALKMELEDAIQFNQFTQNWKIDKNKLLEKIDLLSSAQIYFLLLEINRLWKTGGNLKEFAKSLL